MVRVIRQLRGKKIGALGILCDADHPLTAMEVGQQGYELGYYTPSWLFTRLEHLLLDWGLFVCTYLVTLGCVARHIDRDHAITYTATPYGRKLVLLHRDT